MSDWQQTKKTAIILAILGIAVEAVTVMLLASRRISNGVGTPLIVAGMLLAFIPMFVVARQSRKR